MYAEGVFGFLWLTLKLKIYSKIFFSIFLRYENSNTILQKLNYLFNIISNNQIKTEVVTISQQPSVSNEEQPTIAIITVNYYEKLAVDAMMTNKITFVRHKPEGKPLLINSKK